MTIVQPFQQLLRGNGHCPLEVLRIPGQHELWRDRSDSWLLASNIHP